MSTKFPNPNRPPSGLSLSDISYVLFRHKWKIAVICTLGVIATVLLPVLWPRQYASEAKLFVKYVLDAKTPAQLGPTDPRVKTPDQRGETIINTELEILGSLDLALDVATNIGPERILGQKNGMADPNLAAAVIQRSLLAVATKNSSVIHLVFQHSDPAVVQPVLNQVITSYLRRHAEIHRPVGVFDEFLSRETSDLRTRLAETEQALREAKTNANIISLEDSKKMFADQIKKTQDAIFETEAALAERKATATELTRLLQAAPASPTNAVSLTNAAPVAAQTLAEYRRINSLLDTLLKQEADLSILFTEENPRRKAVAQQIAEHQQQKQQLEEKHPGLLDARVASPDPTAPRSGANLQSDLLTETARIAALQSKLSVLTNQLSYIRERASALNLMEGSITDLERRKELQEQHYKYFAANLEQARINDALGPGRVSNIDRIQSPTPPRTGNSQLRKIMAIVFFGSIAAAIGLAFLIELYWDRSVKRPGEIETRLGLPLFLSIPYTTRNGEPLGLPPSSATALLTERTGDETPDPGDGAADVQLETPSGTAQSPPMPWESGHTLRPYWEALRDRLITYFEIKNLTHNPKLVALTSCAPGSGVSTIAAGLAASLSETGEGKVLLVDMKQEGGAACQFFKGNLARGLDEALALETRDNTLVQDQLYVVSESTTDDRLPRLLPKRFTHLVPQLKASDYDYIIFDMPQVSQISVTPRLARFMDMVLMVVESEKTDREVVKRASEMITGAQSNFGIVLNKGKDYLPKRLQHEL